MRQGKKTVLFLVISFFFLPSCENETIDVPIVPNYDTATETNADSSNDRFETDSNQTDSSISEDSDPEITTGDTETATEMESDEETDSKTVDTASEVDSVTETEDIIDTEPQTVSSLFRVRGSVEQIHIWGGDPHVEMEVVDSSGNVVSSSTTDYQGSLIFRAIPPGKGYVVRLASSQNDFTDKLVVLSVEDSLPAEQFYSEQILEPGYGYITTRDGTKLSVFVSLPGPVEEGPYPTLINYSGYSPSKPGQQIQDIPVELCDRFPVLCNAPEHPSGLIGGVMGYATVGVNMRGTGCSGGAYDFFEPLQLLDGYDAVEIIARQSWVKHNKVGLAGLSYPGISQLFVASTTPPSLGAIAPLSVIADTYSSILGPGGILNDGFAIGWIEGVVNRASPYGQGWEQGRVDEGDLICEENQLLHSQMRNLISLIWSNAYYSEALTGPLDPSSFVHKINVPVFLSGQWQDEQTGPHFAALFDKFSGSPLTRFTASNGVHPDGFAPQVLVEWKAFFDIYISKEIPSLEPIIYGLVPVLTSEIFNTPLEMPLMRFTEFTDYEEAKAAYEAEKPLRIIFETGAHPQADLGAPLGTFDLKFDSWPIPGTKAFRLYFHEGGALRENAPESLTGASSFVHDPAAGRRGILKSGSVWDLLPDFKYGPLLAGKAVAFVSEPLQEDTIMAGHGSVDLWLQSTADDADLEVILTEVRQDGQEMYVQSGWLRASHRGLSPEATELRPVKTHLEEDSRPLVPGEWNSVRVEIMPFAHVFRKGSRIRVSVDTPGDSCVRWKFVLTEYETNPIHAIAHNRDYPSSVVLPVIPDVNPPEIVPDSDPPSLLEPPPCPSLRGQPCRPYEVFSNTPF